VPNLIVLDATLERDKNGSDSNGAPKYNVIDRVRQRKVAK
jgi:hypothetical protein